MRINIGSIDTLDIRDYKLKTKEATFPETFELDMPPVKNQLFVGSCVAHALSTVLEWYSIQEGKKHELSTGFIYGNREQSAWKGEGMVVRDALSAVRLKGDALFTDFPLNIEIPKAIEKFENRDTSIDKTAENFAIKTYFQIKDTDAIKTNLMNNGPCLASMDWYNGYKIENNILHMNKKSKLSGGHCVTLYGWTTEGWLMQNSWGKLWGSDGRVVVPFDTKFNSVWGVIDKPPNESIIITKPQKLIAKFYKIFNFFLGIVTVVKDFIVKKWQAFKK